MQARSRRARRFDPARWLREVQENSSYPLFVRWIRAALAEAVTVAVASVSCGGNEASTPDAGVDAYVDDLCVSHVPTCKDGSPAVVFESFSSTSCPHTDPTDPCKVRFEGPVPVTNAGPFSNGCSWNAFDMFIGDPPGPVSGAIVNLSVLQRPTSGPGGTPPRDAALVGITSRAGAGGFAVADCSDEQQQQRCSDLLRYPEDNVTAVIDAPGPWLRFTIVGIGIMGPLIELDTSVNGTEWTFVARTEVTQDIHDVIAFASRMSDSTADLVVELSGGIFLCRDRP